MSAVPLRLVDSEPRVPAPPTLIDTFDFAAPTPALSLGAGWGLPEVGMRWSLGDHSDFTVNIACGPSALPASRILGILEAAPYLAGNPQAVQRLGIWLNGVPVHQAVTAGPGLIAFFVPAEMADLPLAIGLDHPDARSPAECGLFDDKRRLAFACRRLEFWLIPPAPAAIAPLSPMPGSPGDILAAFESLGDNCEFGIAQRRSGCEPLGLLRFTATKLESLVDLLMHECAGIGDPAHIELDLRGEPPEYILTEKRYNLTYHTFIYADQMPPERVRHREGQKLTLLRRRMLDDLRTGRRIYVIKRNSPMRDEDILALSLLLRRFGPNRLMYVTTADHAHPAGSVRLVAENVAYGYIDRFAPYDDAAQISLDAWVAICRTASALFVRPTGTRQ